MLCSTTRPSPISTSVRMRLVIRVLRPGFSFLWRHFSNLPLDFMISHFCLQALANALQHNTTLTHLNLWANQIGVGGVEARVLQFSIFFRFHILHIAGFSRRNAAQSDPHRDRPWWESLWRCRLAGPVSRSVRRVVAPGAARWQAEKQIWERFKANRKAAAEAAGRGLGLGC